ncbi:MAG: 16S rRNA (guanine(966)-N(2))-methyltransferase RsmD [Acidimicrobiia bacterium]
MRIIAGIARGRRVRGPDGWTTRPFPDRVREAVFSSLGALVEGAVVLDLFAGTGSLGLEALSRGAGETTFVERDRPALGVLHRNVEAVGLGGTIVAADVDRFVAGPLGRYDLVFVDPPYDLPLASVARILEGLEPAVTDGGVVVVHRRRGEEPPLLGSLVLADRRRYGPAEIWRFTMARGAEPS